MLWQGAAAIPEMIALILLLFLLTYSMADKAYGNRRTGLFSICLMCGLMASLCALGLMAIQNRDGLPIQAQYAMTTLSCLLTPMTTSLTLSYCMAEIYAGTIQRGYRAGMAGLWSVYSLWVLLTLTNPWHSWLFAAADGLVLPGSNFFLLTRIACLIQVGVLFLNYFTHRQECDPGLHMALSMLPAQMLVIVLFQLLFPALMIDNLVLALTLLTLFVCCQRQRVHHDRLTAVGSREALSTLMQRMISANHPFTLQQVSLLRFRRVNRRFGLETGDAFLKEIAHTIQGIYPTDQVFRFNGTDFVIFHNHLPDDESNAQLGALRDRFTANWEAKDVRTSLGVSFAQVSYPQGGITPEQLINNLEYCQLQARNLPDSAVVIFDDTVRQQIADREHINELITSNLSYDRFFLCYQPIYDASGQRPCAAEALLRMLDERGRVISPGVFIPAAEENGSIIQVTWMVLGKVCAFLHEHRGEHLPPISINFSAQQFAEHDMCAVIKRYLDHFQIDPSQIKIEITERVFTEINDLLLKNIEGLQEMGVGLYLDDFGTGYSNLASVLNYPIEVVKVDKSLLTESPDEKANDLLQALVSGLKHLDVEVLIEGVETSEQSHRMQDIGVDRMQGFYYAKPMKEKDFLDYMSDQSA